VPPGEGAAAPAQPAPAMPPPPAAPPGVYVSPKPATEAVARPVYTTPPAQLRPVRPPPPRRHGNAGAPFAIGVGGDVLWRAKDAYRPFRQARRGGAFDLLATYDVWTPTRGAIVAAGVSMRFEELSKDLAGDALSLSLGQTTVQAELMARYGVSSVLWPHLRVGVGLVSTQIDVDDLRGGLALDGRDNGVSSTFGAGFTLRTPARLFETWRGRLASLSLGLLLEGGYVLAQDATPKLDPSRDGDVPRATFSAGTLERSGAYLRILGVVRF